MKNRTLATILAAIGIFTITGVAFAAANVNRCGPAAKSPAQWQRYAMQSGTWSHVMGIVNKNKKRYAFHPVDGDSLKTWYNRQVIIAPKAAAGRIPNTGCDGWRVVGLRDKTVSKHWPILGALPDNLTKKDVRARRAGAFKKKVKVAVAYLGQPSCINGTSRFVKVMVEVFVKTTTVVKPKTKPKPTPTTNVCSAIDSPGATVCSTVTYVNVCGTQVVYNGDQKDIQTFITTYIADHCAPTVTTTVCAQSGAINIGQPGPCAFPVPPCPPGTIGTPPSCVAPPVVNPKPAFAPEAVEEIDASYVSGGVLITVTRPMCGLVAGKAGNVVTVTFRADFGSFPNNTASVTIPSTGSARVCATYLAPTHAGVTDRFYGRPYDQTQNVPGDEAASNGFPVKAPQPPPP